MVHLRENCYIGAIQLSVLRHQPRGVRPLSLTKSFPVQECMVHRTSPWSDLQSGLLFRRVEHSAVGLCTSSLTQGNLLVADSPSAEKFGTTIKHSTGMICALLKDALGLNLIRIRLSSYFLEPSMKGHTCWHTSLYSCI